MPDQGEFRIEQVDSMQWNRTVARQVLEDETRLNISFPKDIDPAVIEKVRAQIKQQVLEDQAEIEEHGFEEADSEAD